MKKIFLLGLMVLFLTGCATIGTKIEQTQLKQIEKGKTTKTEIIKIFGDPDSTEINSAGKTTFVYEYTHVTSTPINFIPYLNLLHQEYKKDIQKLFVVFDKSGIVEDYTFSFKKDKPIKSGIFP